MTEQDKHGYVEGYANSLYEKMRRREELQELGVRTIDEQQELGKLDNQIPAMEEMFFGLLGTSKQDWLASQGLKNPTEEKLPNQQV